MEPPRKRYRPNTNSPAFSTTPPHDIVTFSASYPANKTLSLDPEYAVASSSAFNHFGWAGYNLNSLTQPLEHDPEPHSVMFWGRSNKDLSVGGTENSLLGDGLALAPIMNGSTGFCLPGGGYITECFTGFVSPRHDPVNQPNINYDNLYSDDGNLAAEKTCIPSDDKRSYVFQPPAGADGFLDQVPHPITGGQDNVFACDDVAFSSQWPPKYGVMQPLPVETTQPLITNYAMVYPGDPSISMQNWSMNTSAYQMGQHFASPYQTLSGESDLNQDQYPEHVQQDSTPERAKFGPSRRKAFKNPQDREQTAQTRKNIACIRCRILHIRCHPNPLDPKGVCKTCENGANMTISRLPCARHKITDIRLCKSGQVPGMEWTKRWQDSQLKDIAKWASDETKRIHITEGFSSVQLIIEVRKFEPMQGDVMHRRWCAPDGSKKSVLVPPYAILNVKAAQTSYMEYINQDGEAFFRAWLNNKDELLVKTYEMAIEAANNQKFSGDERKLLKLVLQLWVAIRITTRSIRICGEETLGMPQDILDKTSPLHGEIPVPPVMGAQIELILINGIQLPLRKVVLDLLQRLILARKPNTWLTIYLCSFILLHNCALVAKHDAGYAKKHGLKGRYARPAMVEDCRTGADVLLAHWHHCCRASQAFAPGNLATGFQAMAGLDLDQTEFVGYTSRYVQASGMKVLQTIFQPLTSAAKNWQLLRQQRAYEEDFFFVSQLYQEDWQPRNGVV